MYAIYLHFYEYWYTPFNQRRKKTGIAIEVQRKPPEQGRLPGYKSSAKYALTDFAHGQVDWVPVIVMREHANGEESDKHRCHAHIEHPVIANL